ncbi:DUF6817 domain-containing protein [Streptomyces sp. NPDC059071]|uniref:DUF6817 domain-containing protein n=1 Tax=unclassified Streptomyces TaxID=2593676 RepID=UPI003646EE0E
MFSCPHTDGFAESLLPLERRPELAAAIGEEAENLVHFYASCDRDFSYPALPDPAGPFRDRFTDETFTPTDRQRADLAEITAANELLGRPAAAALHPLAAAAERGGLRRRTERARTARITGCGGGRGPASVRGMKRAADLTTTPESVPAR